MYGEDKFLIATRLALGCAGVTLALLLFSLVAVFNPEILFYDKGTRSDAFSIFNNHEDSLILYGKELVTHTSVYLGPKGKVMPSSNGMNCQNCHLEAGTKFLGNNYLAVAATYPKFRNRSGTTESIEKRVNDCIERSLNGKILSHDAKEMQALVAYIKWVGKDVIKRKLPAGIGLIQLNYLDRAADTIKGKTVYQKHCQRCHLNDGSGVMAEGGLEWKYPPLWGKNSFNTGAGLYRISKLAGFIKVNMPHGIATYENPVLTDEEAWDVSAFIISLTRPAKDFSHDWPDISTKPIDHPFGPYANRFPEAQHKYGPFKIIEATLRN